MKEKETQLFDEWPDLYDRWFETPVGSIVKDREIRLIRDLLLAQPGEIIVDAGCGTGIFTFDILASGASVFGLDLSFPMLKKAAVRFHASPFYPSVGDILALPFEDSRFDRAVSVTALEFIEDARGAVRELFRVTKSGGTVVVATLNSLSPWALRRTKEAEEKGTIFSKAFFRSPADLLGLSPYSGIAETAIHFPKDSDPEAAMKLEEEGQRNGLLTGAFVAARWQKP